MAESTTAAGIEQAIRSYIQACNDGDAARITACFPSDAVHYFPTVAKWAGATTIGGNFLKRVQALGHLWTVDEVLVDEDRRAGVLEWTQFDKEVEFFVAWTGSCLSLRRFEFRRFALTARRQSSATSSDRMQDFDYAGRGYPKTRPA